jgi:glycosyltransferase involved in cell wall biosynthesis
MSLTPRETLQALVVETLAGSDYTLGPTSYSDAIELTLAKGDAAFVAWIRSATVDTRSFKSTTHFKIGHSGEPPDKGGYSVLSALCERLKVWERTLSPDDLSALFRPEPSVVPVVLTTPKVDPAIQVHLDGARFTPANESWLPEREAKLRERLGGLKLDARRILIINATKGVQFYPSILDFFLTLRNLDSGVRVTCTGYFPEIFELQAGLDSKGIPRVTIEEASAWSDEKLKEFDAILSIGPNDLMLRCMTIAGLEARLLVLDLAFYHQLIQSSPNWVEGMPMVRPDLIARDASRQVNRVIGYSCQHEEKLQGDLVGVCAPRMLTWRWFNYIPVGFRYARHYLSDRHRFDVALLGSVGRDYSQLDPEQLKGLRFLFLGNVANAPEVVKLQSRLDLTVIPRVDEDTYARLLASSRCVLFPFRSHVRNDLLSVVDALASGTPQLTARHAGLARLEKDQIPAVFFDPQAGDLSQRLRELVADEALRKALSARSIAFTREKLDIYGILERIVREQLIAST